VPVGSIVTVTLPYSSQSPHFVECFHGGKKTWFGKTTLFGFDVDSASNGANQASRSRNDFRGSDDSSALSISGETVAGMSARGGH
jgi:hypothetical protein